MNNWLAAAAPVITSRMDRYRPFNANYLTAFLLRFHGMIGEAFVNSNVSFGAAVCRYASGEIRFNLLGVVKDPRVEWEDRKAECEAQLLSLPTPVCPHQYITLQHDSTLATRASQVQSRFHLNEMHS
jgi:hypothetical protein